MNRPTSVLGTLVLLALVLVYVLFAGDPS